MIRAKWEFLGLGLATVLLVGWGCDSRGGAPSVSSSMEEATVKGTVKIHGKLATGGQVRFDPANVDRKVMARTAPIGKDGSYTITTLVDDNVVSLTGPEIKPELYTVTQTVKVQSGENTIPIEIPPPGAAPAP